jgi:hypothetical protein
MSDKSPSLIEMRLGHMTDNTEMSQQRDRD